MVREYLFPEEYGRNIIWVMLSGFFLRIGATENIFGQIKMPKDNYLFNLDEKNLDNNYLRFKNLHYVVLDGPVQYLEDERLKKIKRKVNIHYVGKLDQFWNKIENSQPLFEEDYKKNREIINNVRQKFPIFFKKYFIKKFFTTLNNLKKMDLTLNHIFGKKKYLFYGYITPTESHIINFQKNLNLDLAEIKDFFDFKKLSEDFNSRLNYICKLKNKLINQNNKNIPYINELILFMIRNLICVHLKNIKSFFIYDGLGGKKNYNAYEMLLGNQHIYLDFGSKVGFDKIYPRQAILQLSNKNNISFNLEEDFLNKNAEDSKLYLKKKIEEFFIKLNVKVNEIGI